MAQKSIFSSALGSVLALALSGTLIPGCSDDFDGTSSSDVRGDFYRGANLDDNVFSVTVDDGPNEWTLPIAKYLAGKGIPATFFFTGCRLTNVATCEGSNQAVLKAQKQAPKPVTNANKTLIAELARMGHLVASHTFTHLTALSKVKNDETIRDEVSLTDDLLRPYYASGAARRLLRTPYGSWNKRVADVIQATETGRSYVGPIGWNIGGDPGVRNRDGSLRNAADWWCWRNEIDVADCATGYASEAAVKGKGLILFHDLDRRSLDLLKDVIPKLEKKGATFVRVDEVPDVATALGTPSSAEPAQTPQEGSSANKPRAKAGDECAAGCIYSTFCLDTNLNAPRYTNQEGQKLVCVKRGDCNTECVPTQE